MTNISEFGFFDVEAVFNSFFSESGKEFVNSTFYMIKDRTTLIIVKHIINNSIVINNDISEIGEPFNIKFMITSYNEVNIKPINIVIPIFICGCYMLLFVYLFCVCYYVY